ncbi:hypothetical protein DY000_02047497 [Brassica cretica]|uniref:Uncharacterized protein n=1 Tax=Brassica cretica TaxID=69181 RepID=A0ABQ7EQM2_BRACR|nr:hypothetical protein DY000_02047497 [Brassica cretica]
MSYYLSIILKNREGDLNTVAQISKLGVGQVYAASVMYWYFLKRIDQRFQLEKAMKILPGGSDEGETGVEQAGRKGERRFYEETMGGEWVFFEAYSDDEAYATALQEVEESEMADSYAHGDYF